MPPKFLTPQEFGAELRIDESKVRQRIRLGLIEAVNASPPLKPGKKGRPTWRIPISELERFKAENLNTA